MACRLPTTSHSWERGAVGQFFAEGIHQRKKEYRRKQWNNTAKHRAREGYHGQDRRGRQSNEQ